MMWVGISASHAEATTVNLPIASNPTSQPVRYSVNGGSWSDAFAGLSYNQLPGAPTTDMYTEINLNSGFVQLSRQFIEIDTSSIPSNAVITSASLTMTNTGNGAVRTDDGINVVLIPTTLTSLTSFSQAARANWTMATSLGSAAMSNWSSAGSTASITLNANGIANIKKGGTTYMGMVTSWDISETIPSSGHINSFDVWANTGTTPPFLTVVYTVPSFSFQLWFLQLF